MRQAFVNGRVLTRAGWANDRGVIVEDGIIQALVGTNDPSLTRAERIDLDGDLLLPGFIDTQVNGGGGALFNSEPTLETIRRIGQAHRRFGTTGFMPTLISDDLDVLERAVSAVQEALDAGVPGVLGIHIEGPFINVERKGVHDSAKFRRIDDAVAIVVPRQESGRNRFDRPHVNPPAEDANEGLAALIVHRHAILPRYGGRIARVDRGAGGEQGVRPRGAAVVG